MLLYKTWRYYNKFDSAKSLRVRYRCVKIPQCGLMEHELKDIAFYVQTHITRCAVVITSVLVRDKPLGSPASVKRVYYRGSKASYWMRVLTNPPSVVVVNKIHRCHDWQLYAVCLMRYNWRLFNGSYNSTVSYSPCRTNDPYKTKGAKTTINIFVNDRCLWYAGR